MSYSFKASSFTNDGHSNIFDFSVTAKTNNNKRFSEMKRTLDRIEAMINLRPRFRVRSPYPAFKGFMPLPISAASKAPSLKPRALAEKKKAFSVRSRETKRQLVEDEQMDEDRNSLHAVDPMHTDSRQSNQKNSHYSENPQPEKEEPAFEGEEEKGEEQEGRCSLFLKVLLFGYVLLLIVALASGVRCCKKEGHCFYLAQCTFSSSCLSSSTPTTFGSDGSIEEMVKPSWQRSENDQNEKGFDLRFMKSGVDDEAENPTTEGVDELQNPRKDDIHKFVDENGIKAKDYLEDMHQKVEIDDWWAELDVVSVWEYFSASELYSFNQEPYLSSNLAQTLETREAKLETYIANPYVEQHSQKAKEEDIEPSFAAHNFEPMEPSFAEYNSEHLKQILLISIASKLPAEDLASPAGAAAQYLSTKGVVALFITILVLALMHIFCKHYKKVHGGCGKVQPYSSASGMKNLYSAMPQREGTQVKAYPSLTVMKIPGQEDVLNAMRHGEGTDVQYYLSPRGVKNLRTLILNSVENHLATHKVQQLSEYRGFGRSTVLLKRKRKNEDLILSSGENHLATPKVQQLSEYRGSDRSTVLLKRMRKNEDLILNGGENDLATHKVQQLSEYRGFGRSTVLLKRKRKNEDLILNIGENHLATHKVQQLSEYRGFGRSTVLLKRKRKNGDLWERHLKTRR